ncbi:MAG: electron transfer protein subunit alpha [Chloroflexi bacterium]|nr:MAG: electron transfer protein subunit alpha [Chloroflexota bacterium]
MSGILVYSEKPQLLRELLGKARQVATEMGTDVAVAYLGESVPETAADLGNWGADTVYTVTSPLLVGLHPEPYTDALAGIVEQMKPELVLVGATKPGLEISARTAARLGVGLASFCVDFRWQDGCFTADCMIYSGVGKNSYKITTKPAIATVNAAVFTPTETGGAAQVTAVDVTINPPSMKIVEYKAKAAAGVRWEDAPMIVDVGQGMNQKEDLGLAQELADLFAGQVACSRPVSSERDWFPEWLGLSGKRIHADLCVTLGISGSIQHVVGIRDSKTIVAINIDENAGIFSQADYGVVADLHKFVPILTAALKTKSAKLA